MKHVSVSVVTSREFIIYCKWNINVSVLHSTQHPRKRYNFVLFQNSLSILYLSRTYIHTHSLLPLRYDVGSVWNILIFNVKNILYLDYTIFSAIKRQNVEESQNIIISPWWLYTHSNQTWKLNGATNNIKAGLNLTGYMVDKTGTG